MGCNTQMLTNPNPCAPCQNPGKPAAPLPTPPYHPPSQVRSLAAMAANTKRHGAPFRHMLFYGGGLVAEPAPAHLRKAACVCSLAAGVWWPSLHLHLAQSCLRLRLAFAVCRRFEQSCLLLPLHACLLRLRLHRAVSASRDAPRLPPTSPAAHISRRRPLSAPPRRAPWHGQVAGGQAAGPHQRVSPHPPPRAHRLLCACGRGARAQAAARAPRRQSGSRPSGHPDTPRVCVPNEHAKATL
jgi:hypothetical protein